MNIFKRDKKVGQMKSKATLGVKYALFLVTLSFLTACGGGGGGGSGTTGTGTTGTTGTGTTGTTGTGTTGTGTTGTGTTGTGTTGTGTTGTGTTGTGTTGTGTTGTGTTGTGTTGTGTGSSTYTSNNLTVFTQISSIRQSSGAGAVVQASSLDTSATAHSSYLVNNNLVTNVAFLNSVVGGILGGHSEDATKPGFTGITPLARATAAGFSGTVSELLSFGAVDGTACMASIENSVYHLAQLISPFAEIGLSFNAGNGSGPVCVIEFGITSSDPLLADGSWVFYPNGQTNIAPKFYNTAEAPNPAPDLLLAGHPVVISMQSNPSSLAAGIVLHTFTLTPAAGSPVSARILASTGVTTDGTPLTTDTNISGSGTLVLLPITPLDPNTVYTVAFTATVKGTTAVNKTWSFTTGNTN